MAVFACAAALGSRRMIKIASAGSVIVHIPLRIVTQGFEFARTTQRCLRDANAGVRVTQRNHQGAGGCRGHGIMLYFFGAHGEFGAQGLSPDFFFFFFAGPQGLLGAQGLSAFALADADADGALLSAGVGPAASATAGASMAVLNIKADRVSRKWCLLGRVLRVDRVMGISLLRE